MEEKFTPEKYGMMFCPDCDGQGRICGPDDVKICQNCGGFGFVKKGKRNLQTVENGPYPNA